MKDTQKTYRVTWSIDVDATSPETAVEVALKIRLNRGTQVTVPDEVIGTERKIQTYSERLAENTAKLSTNGKLIETVVEIAWNMALARFRPNDSYEFHNLAKDWAAEFEALYDDRVASYEWDEDAWRERCEHFTREKVDEVVLAGLGRIVAEGKS
ncbi:hypothetical protein [Rhodanobacter soli]|uniref:hypothetical protein n=1 Tax=Rhodanobacter soli TaxID=590609 RepID=UPI0031E285EA